MLLSSVCRHEHFDTDWYRYWASVLPLRNFGIDDSVYPERPHRKAWEWCTISQALSERGMLEEGRRGCGFAVGTEPLPSAFAARGVDVLATDQAATDEAGDWIRTGQHAASLEVLYRPELITRAAFQDRVTFRSADMRQIDIPFDESYDFVWSSCSIEHLGDLAAGMRFVEEAMGLLKIGGVAVHTTEFNVSSNENTIDTGDAVVYRQQDIEALDRSLRRVGCGLARCDFYAGDSLADLAFDEWPFGMSDRKHLKLVLGGHVSTSFVLIVRKGLPLGISMRL